MVKMTSPHELPPAERLALLRANRAEHEQALEVLEPELGRANARLDQARAVYDAAAAAYAANQRDGAGSGRRRAQAEQEAADVREVHEAARDALQVALRARNARTCAGRPTASRSACPTS
jgi:hypothetical protein